jgi:hypothetical protein
MRVPCHEVTSGPGSVARTKRKRSSGVLGKIHRGEQFSSRELCRVIGRRKKSDVSPPRMAGALGRWRAGILAAHS